jgi:hypothetical protein
MPEEFTPEEEFAEKFQQLLDDQVDNSAGLTVGMIDHMEVVLYCRLRSLFSPQQLHGRAHMIIVEGEQLLMTPGAVLDPETNQPIQPILVENWQGTREEYANMLESSTTQLTDDDIEAFFASGEEEE